MGIEYSLVNYRTKQCIDLGKGSWQSDLNVEPAIFLYREEIRNLLNDVGCFENKENWEYWEGVIDLIWNFVKEENLENIIVVNDCDDSNYILKSFGYRWISSRYSHNSPEELKEYLELLNGDHQLNRERFYNKEEAIKYIGTSKLDVNKL